MRKTISNFALHLISFFILCSQGSSLSAQCNTVIESPENCDFIYLLDGNVLAEGFCASLPASNAVPELTPFCFGISSSENTGFFLIEPITTELRLKIIPKNCTEIEIPGQGTFSGMQAAIFTSCEFSEFVACAPTCHPDEFTIGANDFQPFTTYLLALDGCNGSICDFSIEVVEGAISSLVPLIDPVLVSPESVCQFDESEIKIEGLPLLTEGAWSVDGEVEFEVKFNGKAIKVNDWGTPGLKSVCATITDPENMDMYYDSCWQVLVRTAPNIISISDGDSLCPGEQFDLNFDALGYDSFNWNWSNGSCNNCADPVFEMGDSNTTVNLILSNNNGCSISQSVEFAVMDPFICLVDTHDPKELSFSIYPNPFQFSFEVKTQGKFQAMIFNNQGSILLQSEGLDFIRIDGEDWGPGIYFLSVVGENGNQNFQKIVKY